MKINREQLYGLIDAIDVSEYNILYHLLSKFIPEDVPTPDEVDAIRVGREALDNGEFVRYEDIDWD